MALDGYANLAVAVVQTAPTPPGSGTSLTLVPGMAAQLPAPPFNATVWPAATVADWTNAEIVRVTAIVGNTVTLVRNAEPGPAAGRAIVAGDYLAATFTAKWIGDLTNAGNLTGTLADARLSANVAVKNAANTFTANQTISPGNLVVAGTGPHTFSTGVSERMRIAATGEVLIGGTASLGPVGLAISTDATAVRPPVILQNTNATSTGNLLTLLNSAGGIAGAILQVNATTVAYTTTSDARLKDDAGRATDLTALRAVVVHDFAWTADGGRDRGVFAQEAHPLYPRAITPGTDETTESGALAQPWLTDYSKFVADLIVGWQQHDADLADLRAAVAALRQRLDGDPAPARSDP